MFINWLNFGQDIQDVILQNFKKGPKKLKSKIMDQRRVGLIPSIFFSWASHSLYLPALDMIES